ncbi:MAG: hypothetical protein N2C14_28630 [Planctomycetales bacterium]
MSVDFGVDVLLVEQMQQRRDPGRRQGKSKGTAFRPVSRAFGRRVVDAMPG